MSDAANTNLTLRDEICEYWSMRAETFDLQPGHEIFSNSERGVWHELIARHFQKTKGNNVLDLACGTGVITHLLDDLGFEATGIDWSEAMLAKAREKAKIRKRSITFLQGDAEETREPDETYDGLITRHLVWTLVDPQKAFQHWFKLLKPGGILLIIDGDFVTKNILEKALNFAIRKFTTASPAHSDVMRDRHQHILSQVYFSHGAKADEVKQLLTAAGFSDIEVQSDMSAIHREQAKAVGFLKSLSRRSQHRYAIRATKAE
ncbi:MAG: SAM-dependent methyltransferase [Hyphomicrobiales bacterium]|nr:methyltransferase domain-containing protein [Hyphomicrobiales bacterium]PCH50689.1 MAG: SAM-dependent methyltransferase [Hyphomicrobiales bacterium]